MGIPADIGESIKKHIYSIATGLIIALLTFGYVSYILPANERKEDAKNIAILKGIERQLNAYIDDQVKYISEDKMKSLKLDTYKGSTVVHIDTITIEKSGREQLQDGTITLSRRIKLSGISKNKNFTQKDSIFKDTLSIDLVKFLNKINSTTHFTSFYICPVVEGKCQVQKPILSENVSLVDQDSLIRNNRKNGPFSFRNSDKHYYTDQINIPQTNHTLFLAAGIDQSYFQTSVRQIDSNILIFSLLLIIILILGINFIKPIISSYKERLSQVDLVGVVFSVGILVAVMVVFGVLSIWDNTVKSRNIEDLTALVNKIDTSFTQQIETYQNWRNNDSLFGKKGENAKNKFAKIYLDSASKITALNGDPLTESDSSLAAEQKIFLNNSDLKKDSNSKLINYLDGYFRMDKTGLITTNLSNTIPDIPRKYADRMYFKILQQRNLDNQNIDKNVNTVLTAVFSREDDKYQWIFAEKDTLKNQKSENNGIKGIAFREFFSTEIELPPGTGYMLIDRNGDVLMQNDPEKNLYQNLLYGSQNNLELISLLAGKIPKSFEMEYQGIPYQICPIKLRAESDSPIYILGIRDLSHLNRLSIFTFSNGFLLSVFFGFLMLVIAYVYSTLFYSDHISMFSNHHFYHLFPDNSRTYEYKLLLKVTCIAILMGVLMSFLSSPSIAFFFCIILGINLALTNLITLNIRRVDPKTKLIKLLLIVFFLGVCLPMTFFLLNNSFLAIVVLFGTHISLILYHRNWRTRENVDLQTFITDNHGVNRKAYTLFLTSRLIFQFVVFPFVLISGFYMNELNDFVRYYCSSNQVKEQKINQKDFIIKDRIINAYSCDCKKDSIEKPLILGKNKDKILEKANVGFLDRPAMYEIKKFAFNKLSDKYYINSHAIVPKENKYSFLLIIFLLFIGLSVLAYQLINYYSNRFFFYDLMQAAYERYYPCTKKPLANEHIFIAMVNNDDIKSLIQVDPNKEVKSDNASEDLANCPDRKINIDKVFDLDTNNEISPFLKMDFILKYNNKKFGKEYNDIWDSLTTETRYVLYDFAQDHFVNYKNKDTLMFLMEKGIIDCHQLTGRLKMMSLSFRIFILCRSKHDELFLQKFKEESKDGTFSKLKFPMLIIAISGLVLLMYLNKDSYDRVAVMGGSIVSVIALINKFLEANKSL